MHSTRLLGVVLCGGRSARMGRDKATLSTVDGVDFLTHAIARLRPLCDSVCVSGRADQRTDERLLPDPPRSFGPISGIVTALAAAEEEGFAGCLINPVDTPMLKSTDLQPLVDAFQSQPNQIVSAVSTASASSSTASSDRVEPLIAIYPIGCLPSLRESIDAEQYGLQRYLKTRTMIRVAISAAACNNVNTPQDLKSVQQ